MIETICTKVIDILQASTTLYAGGNAYTTGWPGVTRESLGIDPVLGYINLFDKAHDLDGFKHRPAIYVGTHNIEAVDQLDFDTQSAQGRFEYRVLSVPLYVCVLAASKNEARNQRNQLVRNIRTILGSHIVEDGYWYELRMGLGSGSNANRVWTTATGGNAQAVAEGNALISLSIRYSWNITCDA